MMSIKQKLTGKPSIDRPWMQYYPQEMIENLTVPNSTIYEYLMYNCPGDDVVAIHYYGRDITWKQIKEETDKVARALKAVGFGENDEIPMFLRSVPEFIFLLLGAEKIGASLLCRDNTIEENVAAVKKAGAKIMLLYYHHSMLLLHFHMHVLLFHHLEEMTVHLNILYINSRYQTFYYQHHLLYNKDHLL